VSAKGQTRREAGAQSHGPHTEVAGPPKGAYAVRTLDGDIDARSQRCRVGLRRVAKGQVKAQLRTSSDRRSKILKDREHIEATVEVEGVGRLVLKVDGGGGYSLRGYPEGAEASGRDLLAVGVMHAEGIEAIYPYEVPVTESE
jgi:hypothetical protein